MPKAAPVPDLLDDIFDAEQFSQENLAGALLWLPLAKIYDNPYQTRSDYDAAHIERLADNIWSLRDDLPATHGLQQPPLARLVEFGVDGDEHIVERDVYRVAATVRKLARAERYAVQLHFGHNRLRAWKLLRERDFGRYSTFPVLLAYADDPSMWRHAVAENAQRKDISAIEEALSIHMAISRFNLTQEQAGQPFGYAKSTVSNKLRLLDLPDELRTLLAEGAITERHGRELLRLAPAPTLYAQFSGAKLDWLRQASTGELQGAIDRTILVLRPLPPAPKTGYAIVNRWGELFKRKEQFDPPEWPYTWQPPDGAGVGACIGCRFYAHFGGDPGARCSAATDSCYNAKTAAWRKEQAAVQAAALFAAPASTGAALIADTPSASPASKPASAPTASKPAPPAPPPAAPEVAGATAAITWFSTDAWRGAPAVLIEKGLCSQDRCECFRLAYNPEASEHHVRPDAVGAPNLCYGCTSEARRRNRRTEMEHGDVQEHRKRMKAEDAEAERRLRAWLDSASADDIWHNPEFMRSILTHGFDIEKKYEAKDWDTPTVQAALFLGVARVRCSRWDNQTRRWSLDAVQEWLAKLDTAIGRAELPVPQFDAQVEPEPLDAADLTVMRPAPLVTYTDDDERNHQCLMVEWDGASWQSLEKLMRRCAYDDDPPCTITPAVIRHIAQDCSIDSVRRDMLALAEWLETVAEVAA